MSPPLKRFGYSVAINQKASFVRPLSIVCKNATNGKQSRNGVVSNPQPQKQRFTNELLENEVGPERQVPIVQSCFLPSAG